MNLPQQQSFFLQQQRAFSVFACFHMSSFDVRTPGAIAAGAYIGAPHIDAKHRIMAEVPLEDFGDFASFVNAHVSRSPHSCSTMIVVSSSPMSSRRAQRRRGGQDGGEQACAEEERR